MEKKNTKRFGFPELVEISGLRHDVAGAAGKGLAVRFGGASGEVYLTIVLHGLS